MPKDDNSTKINGKIESYEAFDGMKLTLTTPEGKDYLINSKKWIKKLSRYADEEVDVQLEGTIDYDDEEGMDVIAIKSFTPSQELGGDLPTLLSQEEDLRAAKKPQKPRRNDDDDEEEVSLDDWDKTEKDEEEDDDNDDNDDSDLDLDLPDDLKDLAPDDLPDDFELDDEELSLNDDEEDQKEDVKES